VEAEREILRGDHCQLNVESAGLKTRSAEYTPKEGLPAFENNVKLLRI
jgi:hypothetical protein